MAFLSRNCWPEFEMGCATHRVPRGSNSSLIELRNLKIDLSARKVLVQDKEVHLTPIEFKLLTSLVRHTGKVLTHQQLLKEVWEPGHMGENHYLRVFMTTLRRKLEADPARPQYLLTV
jgi:two-component system KDP operon response regulator KdpE